jgi:serine/threonine-protein kinase
MGTSDDSTVPLPEGARPPAALATTPSDTDPLVGAVLDHYRIDTVIGRGGMGVVYRAFDTRLERPVAVKTVLFDRIAAKERFEREARALAKLQHENVVTVHVVGEHAGLTYLVMELVPNGSLQDLLRREGKVSERRALEITDEIASALEAAHARGLIHRDVKPSNILIEADGNVLLTDFGLAKELRAPDVPPPSTALSGPRSLTEPGSALGTPAYRAPEQARGERVDHRADMYALGVTLCELLTGERISESPSLDGVSSATREIVARLSAENPDARFATYGDLRAAIARAVSDARVLPGSRALRAIAYIIDFSAWFAVSLILVVSAQVLARRWGATISNAIAQPLIFVVAAAIAAIVEMRFATTLGKRLFRLSDVDAATAERPARGRLALRALAKALPMSGLVLATSGLPLHGQGAWLFVTVIAILGAPAFASSRAALHDRLAGTRIVRIVEEGR